VSEVEKEKAYSRTEALLSTISDTAASVLVTSYFVTLKVHHLFSTLQSPNSSRREGQ
jgi:hypothetical protein